MWELALGALAALSLTAAAGHALLTAPTRGLLSPAGPARPSSAPPGGALGAGNAPADAHTTAGARAEYAAFVPSTEAVVGPLPRIDPGPLLRAMQPVQAPSVDLTLAGLKDDRETADQEIWRAVRVALGADGSATGRRGGGAGQS